MPEPTASAILPKVDEFAFASSFDAMELTLIFAAGLSPAWHGMQYFSKVGFTSLTKSTAAILVASFGDSAPPPVVAVFEPDPVAVASGSLAHPARSTQDETNAIKYEFIFFDIVMILQPFHTAWPPGKTKFMLSTLVSSLATFAFSSQPMIRMPDVHGDIVAFSCESDIWVGNLSTGHAQRLTNDAGREDSPRISPDGTMIAFHGEYDGFRGAYVIPITGGAPKRVTYATDFRAVTGWLPDSSGVIYRTVGQPTNYVYWIAPLKSGTYQRLPMEFASHVSFGPDNNTFCLTRFNRWYTSWFNYVGGLQNQIWTYSNKKFRQITSIPGTNEFPVWAKDRIYFVNENKSEFSLMSIQPDGKAARTEYGPIPYEIRELTTDGDQIAFEAGVQAYVFNKKDRTCKEIAQSFISDNVHTRPFKVNAADFASGGAALSPNSKRVFISSRGQIVSAPVGEGESRLWKGIDGVRLSLPEMSPDSKQMAYVSDQSGEQQIVVSDPAGNGEKILTHGERQIKSLAWTPDSKWIVYYDSRMELHCINLTTGEDKFISKFSGTWYGPRVSFSPDSNYITFSNSIPRTTINAVFIYQFSNGALTQVSNGRADDTSPSFSLDGKWIAFQSFRSISVANDPILNQLNVQPACLLCLLPLRADTKSPLAINDPNEDQQAEATKTSDPMKIDMEGLYDRLIELPASPIRAGTVVALKDRILYQDGPSIQAFDLNSKKSFTLTKGEIIETSKDGSKLLVTSDNSFRVVDTSVAFGTEIPATSGLVSLGNLKLDINPQKEWNQIYWDAWRLLRDYFYVSNMHGTDWKAIGAKYAEFLPRVKSRDELNELIRWLQCELGSSHQYLSVVDVNNIKPRLSPAYLGIDLGFSGSNLRIDHIVQGDGFRSRERSPLADPSLGVKEGMYLLKIGGKTVTSSIEVGDMLLGRAGQIVSVTVNDKPTLDGARTVFVKPVASEARMRYLDWVEKNRQYVEKLSGGRVGYIHLAAMSDSDMVDFVKQYFPQRNKEALIVDDRFNNGGYIQTLINTILGAKVSGYFNMRNSAEPWSRQSDAFIGPMACLINEFCISCGEEFPHRFKDLGLGPLIGRRTEGGEVGSSPGWPLVDGATISVPNYGMFTTKEGWVIEGAGVSPDIDIPSDPNAYVEGRDPQLDAGVKAMLDAIQKKPNNWPKEPPARTRMKKG